MATALDPSNTLRATKSSALAASDPLAALIKGYLSGAHRDTVAGRCPLPALAADVARKSDTTRESYERDFLRYVNEIEGLLPESSVPPRERALAIVAQCVGGLMLSRAVRSEKLSDQILKSCHLAAMTIREDKQVNE